MNMMDSMIGITLVQKSPGLIKNVKILFYYISMLRYVLERIFANLTPVL